MNHTRIERLILFEVMSRADWEAISLFSLASKLNIHYGNARRAIERLEREGWLRTEKPRGRDMVISLRGPAGFQHPKNDPPYRGRVSTNYQNVERRTQKGEDMSNLINSLRATLASKPDYPRPELSQEEKDNLQKIARQMAAIKDERLRLAKYIAVCIENAILLKEVNEHREKGGFAPLTIHNNGHHE